MPPSIPLRVAIVGCGKIADAHVEAIRRLPDRATLIAVCDREALMAEQLALRFAVPARYDRLEALLERERPDVLHIATPPGSHAAIARQALEAGCHLYVEKPFALNVSDVRDVLAMAERRARKVTVGYSSLFDPPALALRELVAEGVLGTPVHVESWYGYNLASPFGAALLADPGHFVHGLPGKLFHNIIDHMLNKIVEFVPDDAPAVLASALSLRRERFGDLRDELRDELRVIVRGAQSTGYGTFTSHVRPVAQFVRVYGTRNIAHVDFVARTVSLEAPTRLPSAFGRLLPPFEQAARLVGAGARNLLRFARSDYHYFAGLHELVARFYGCIAGDGPPPIPYRDVVRVSALMDEIFRQVRAAGRPA